MICKDVISVKGVGKKYADIFYQNGISTIEDLIMFFPKGYEFLNGSSGKNIFEGVVVEVLKDVVVRKNLILTTIKMKNENGRLAKLVYFNRPYMKHNFVLGNFYRVYGTAKEMKNFVEIMNAEKIKDNDNEILPKYKSIKGISNNYLSNVLNTILSSIKIQENLPQVIVKRRGLLSLEDAIKNIHLPQNKFLLNESFKRFKYQELMYFLLKMKFLKSKLNLKSEGIKFKIYTEELIKFKESLKFDLTNDQNKVIKQILIEQKGNFSVNRLLQGDVGSGKTIVAFITIFNVLMNGYKACMIVPTEILAMQHFKEACELFEKFNLNVRLLSGSVKDNDKKIIRQELLSEEPLLLIGTHAILEDNVEIHKLGYVVFDEQHRFGVSQRSKLISKSREINCDVLVMTATPIPRTLFLYIYNGMDVSSIRELPKNRKPITTIHLKNENREAIYKILMEEIEKGGQCYVVSPLIEESEKLDLTSINSLYDEFKNSILSSYNIDLIHGKMDNNSKNEVMQKFKDGHTHILISTTVIEVGISVENATVMVIQNAERFGLSQIHQIRGRVGRGFKEGLCVLVTNSMNEVTKKRISTLIESNDGFYLSEQDLRIRGSGDVFGYRQHGETGFVFADVIEDIDIMRNVKEDIEYMDELNDDEVYRFYDNFQKKLDDIDKTICFN